MKQNSWILERDLGACLNGALQGPWANECHRSFCFSIIVWNGIVSIGSRDIPSVCVPPRIWKDISVLSFMPFFSCSKLSSNIPSVHFDNFFPAVPTFTSDSLWLEEFGSLVELVHKAVDINLFRLRSVGLYITLIKTHWHLYSPIFFMGFQLNHFSAVVCPVNSWALYCTCWEVIWITICIRWCVIHVTDLRQISASL